MQVNHVSELWCVGLNSANECGYIIKKRKKNEKKSNKTNFVISKLRLCKWTKKIGRITKITVGHKFNIYEIVGKKTELLICSFIRECQKMFPYETNSLYIIPSDITFICFSYFDDNMYKEYWSAGKNSKGQCGVGHTKKLKSAAKVNISFDVQNICIGINGSCPIWIENKTGEIWLHGKKAYHSFGDLKRRLEPDKSTYFIDKYPPIKCIDAGCTNLCSIFVCDNGSVWSFGSTSNFGENGCGFDSLFWNVRNSYWKRMTGFDEIISSYDQIKGVNVGDKFSMFLSVNNNVYSCGINNEGQLGLGDCNDDRIRNSSPTMISFEDDEKIDIKRVECGMNHSIALTFKGKVYVWGSNQYTQCAVNKTKPCVNIPTRIKAPKIKEIRCGAFHNGFMSKNNEWYLWGSNSYNQCNLYKTKKEISCVYSPQHCRINARVAKITNMPYIMDITLGYETSLILVSNIKPKER